MTPDEHFIVGVHPRDPSGIVAAGFSGHGFKFSPAIGEIIVDWQSTERRGSTAIFSRRTAAWALRSKRRSVAARSASNSSKAISNE